MQYRVVFIGETSIGERNLDVADFTTDGIINLENLEKMQNLIIENSQYKNVVIINYMEFD